jgi:hypothetical protein
MCIPQLMHRAGIAERDLYGRSGRDLSPADTWDCPASAGNGESVQEHCRLESRLSAGPGRHTDLNVMSLGLSRDQGKVLYHYAAVICSV